MNKESNFDKRWLWIGLGAITLVLRYVLPASFIETCYSRGLFLWIRRVFDYGVGWLPIPLIYVFYFVLIVWAIRKLLRTEWKKLFTVRGLLNWLFSASAFIGGVLIFFFWLWGFNYGRVPFVQQQGLKITPVKLDTLEQELTNTTDKLLAVRMNLDPTGNQPISDAQMPANLEALCRKTVEQTLAQLNYPVAGRVRGRILPTKGILMRFSSSGVYWPFVGEGNIDGGLYALQQPFTLCHELSHGYGITNEGVCNFLGYLATQNAKNTYINYSGLICYWRYIAIAYQRFAPKKYRKFRKTLPVGLQADLDAINENLKKYPDILPRLRYVAYDSYLKSQGIADGMQSYSSIIMLVRAWKKARDREVRKK